MVSHSTFVRSRRLLSPDRKVDARRFYNVHDHWLRRFLTEDCVREVRVRLLGVIGARDDDHLSVR